MKSIIHDDREFYKTLVRLAVPIILQNLVASALNMVDTIMVGQLGSTEIASVGLANQVFFILNLFLFGVNSGAAIFTAQFWGKGDIQNIKRVLGLNIVLGVSAALIVTMAAACFPQQVLAVFSKDSDVVILGGQYLRIVAISYTATAVTFSYAFTLRSTQQVRLPMMVSFLALGLNTILNYVLIFGKLGFPAMGVRGAAIATVAARVVEMLMLLGTVYIRDYEIAAKIREMIDVSGEFIRQFIATITPVILNELLWAIGVSLYSVVYGRMGTGIIASINIVSTVERLAMVAFFAMGHACAVMVGNQIGAGEENKAFYYAKRFITVGPTMGIFMSIFLMAGSRLILLPFRVPADVSGWAAHILLIASVLMPLRIFNMIMIVGILRSGGDTRFSLIMDAFGTWLIAVPMAILGGLVLRLSIELVYIMIATEEIFKFVLGIRRFVTRKWINNLAKHIEQEV